MDLVLEYLARYLSRYTYIGLFLILSVGAFGFPIPEEFVLVAAGLFVHQGVTTLGPTLLVCGVGQVIGDLLLYFVGRRYGRNALHGLIGRLVPATRLETVLAKIDRYGLLVVFFGRYLTGVRPAVFLGAGAAGIPVRRFMLVDGLSAVVSLLVWVTLGWAFSGWIEVALAAVNRAEEQILAGLLAVVLVIALEKVLVRIGNFPAGSRAARVSNWVRIPAIVVTVVFAVLIAREHHVAQRDQMVAGAEADQPRIVKDMGLLIEVLPELASPERPIEVVFVGSGDLLEEALSEAGYRPSDVRVAETGDLFARPPDERLVPLGNGDRPPGLRFWRSNYVYRSQPVWFGQFEGNVTVRALADLSRSLTRAHYTLRTAVGPRLHPGEKRRVLVAVLRHPILRD